MENNNNQKELDLVHGNERSPTGAAGEETVVNGNVEEPLDLARSVRELT
ncbi:hypothetical protein A2U01_0050558, partial [Trifolium medium]|nr:hypothetical protein [Trifolium medium]